MTRRALLAAGAGLAIAAPAAAAPAKEPWRYIEAASGRGVTWDDMLARLALAEAVFVGEQHDDPETHRVEAALLEGLRARVGGQLSLAMEMLERDAQPALDDYLAGRIGEEAFGKAVSLWPNYPTDYRPMVEYARRSQIPVIASNVPRRIARLVARGGIDALKDLPAADRSLVPEFTTAPDDAYAERFRRVMSGGHGQPGGMDAATVRRFYEAQCLKDDTMAESVARALSAGRRVLHINGAFHSDAGVGVPARLLWRRPLTARPIVVSIVPLRGEIAAAPVGGYRTEADYAILVPDRRPAEKP